MQQPVKDDGYCYECDDDHDDRLDGLEFCLAHGLPDDTVPVRFEDAPPAAVGAAIGTPADQFGHALFEIPAVARFETFRLAAGAWNHFDNRGTAPLLFRQKSSLQ